MKANNPEQLDTRLANWIARLIQTQPILHNNAQLISFMAYIAEEDIKTILQLTELFEQWRDGGVYA